ncbi:MAG TPA: type I-E CRISPR-associated endoribonuclease Cas2e [Thermomicrobiaceae bacterium]|nr:type I-E CRISPR-associated endoribonuclease Cas2e [Thermomicrobiaceae bacterium]
MVIMILERVPVSLRGELTRWLIEPKAGVFVGSVSALVRDRLWEKACKAMKGGAGVLIHNADNEQGYAIQIWGERDRKPVDFDGLWLIRTVSE